MERVMSRAVVGRLIRCFAVSVGSTILTTTVLIALAIGGGMRAGVANVIAVCCGVVPSYFANRRWVWKRDGRGSIASEAVPYVVLSLVGLVTSSLAVAWVGARSVSWPSHWRAIALPLANLAVWGALWLVQFVILDRVIWPTRRVAAPVAEV
jgi:putative flippase GtrA